MTQESPKTIEIKVLVDIATGRVLGVNGPLNQKIFVMASLALAQLIVANHTEPVIKPSAVMPSKRDVIPFNGGQG